jgi:two-component system response regulator DegU
MGGTHNLKAPIYRVGLDMMKPTPRQLEILSLVREGHNNRQIGLILRIRESTVKNHIRSAMIRLKASDRTSAVIIAIRHGYLGLYGVKGRSSNEPD